MTMLIKSIFVASPEPIERYTPWDPDSYILSISVILVWNKEPPESTFTFTFCSPDSSHRLADNRYFLLAPFDGEQAKAIVENTVEKCQRANFIESIRALQEFASSDDYEQH
mgnify:CR=1 FL=1